MRVPGKSLALNIDYVNRKDALAQQDPGLCGIIETLFAALNSRDELTAIHSLLVAEYCFMMANILDPANAIFYYYGGLCHDLGKFAMPDYILKSKRVLSQKGKEKVKAHVMDGANLLMQLALPQIIVEVALYHHERFEGSGYPFGFMREDIPLPGRIAAVADVYSAIVVHRPYMQKRSHAEAISILKRESHLYDPNILKIFLDIVQPFDYVGQKVI